MSHVLPCSEGSGLQGCQQVSRLLQLGNQSFDEIAATSHKDCYLSIIGWHRVSSSPNDSFASGESLIDCLEYDSLKGLSADSVVASFRRNEALVPLLLRLRRLDKIPSMTKRLS